MKALSFVIPELLVIQKERINVETREVSLNTPAMRYSNIYLVLTHSLCTKHFCSEHIARFPPQTAAFPAWFLPLVSVHHPEGKDGVKKHEKMKSSAITYLG